MAPQRVQVVFMGVSPRAGAAGTNGGRSAAGEDAVAERRVRAAARQVLGAVNDGPLAAVSGAARFLCICRQRAARGGGGVASSSASAGVEDVNSGQN